MSLEGRGKGGEGKRKGKGKFAEETGEEKGVKEREVKGKGVPLKSRRYGAIEA